MSARGSETATLILGTLAFLVLALQWMTGGRPHPLIPMLWVVVALIWARIAQVRDR